MPNDRTNPTSWTWTSKNLTDTMSDDYTDEFYPSLSVDPADGAIYISYYRTNSGVSSITPRKTQVHYVMTKSIDGGATFAAPTQITDLPTNESGSGANASMQWGDYTWNDVINGTAYAAWTDRPGGFLAAIGALSARAAAQQHGGSASAAVGERRGTAIRLNLARTH